MLKNISLKLRYALSFLTILLVVVLFMSAIYEYSQESSIRYINTKALEKFTSAADNISATIRNMDDLASIATSANLPLKEDIGSVGFDSQVIALLGRIKARLPEDVRVLLLPRGSKYIYTEEERLVYGDFERMLLEDYNLAMSKFYYLCSSETGYAQIPILKPDGTPGAIARIVPLPSEHLDYSGSLIFLYPEALLTAELERYMGDLTGDLYIYDYYYKQLYVYIARSEPQAPYSQLIRVKGVGLQKFDSNTVLLSVSHADTGLNYLLCEDAASFYQEMVASQHRLLVRMILLIVILVILFSGSIYVNYFPVRRLTSQIVGEDQNALKGNELMLIRDSYEHTVEEMKRLSDQLSDLMTIAMRHFLMRWIQGQIATREVFDNQIKYYGLSFPYEYYAAIYLPTASIPRGISEQERLMNLLKTVYFQRQSTISCDLPDKNAILLIVNYDQPSDGSDVLMTTTRHLNKMLAHGGFERMHFGVGRPYCDPLKLPDSFWEASIAVQFSRDEEESVCFYSSQVSDVDGSPANHALPPMSVSLMTNAISRGDSTIAHRALREIVAHIRDHAESLLIFRFYTNNLLRVILNAAESNHVEYPQANLRHLIEYNSIQEFTESIMAFVEDICKQVVRNHEQADVDVHNKLMTYILEHYKEYSFSNQSVAENTGIPNKQISNIIRKETGLNFVQYISYLRMNEFKRLLRETDCNITELVDEIGYSDASNFLRKFRTMEGMTASQYRTQYALSQKMPDEEP